MWNSKCIKECVTPISTLKVIQKNNVKLHKIPKEYRIWKSEHLSTELCLSNELNLLLILRILLPPAFTAFTIKSNQSLRHSLYNHELIWPYILENRFHTFTICTIFKRWAQSIYFTIVFIRITCIYIMSVQIIV